MEHNLRAMKTTRIIIKIAAPCLATTLSLFIVSCGAPDPAVQKEMDKDIMSAAEKKGPGTSASPQYMKGSRGYGLGGY